MKRFLVLLTALSCFILHTASIDLGIKIPGAFAMNIAGGSGFWPGFKVGGGLAIDFTLVNFGDDSAFGIESYGLFTVDKYFLPTEKFSPGTYQMLYTLDYGLNLKLWVAKGLYIGIGPMFASRIGGQYGDASTVKSYPDGTLGTDIFVSVLAGCAFFISDSFYIPLEIKVNGCLNTLPSSFPLDAGVNVGFIYRIGL